jgi:CRISPR/Cas system-associated endonuclease Cas3-HD
LRNHVEEALKVVGGKLIIQGRLLTPNFSDLLQKAIIFHDFGKVPFNRLMFREGRKLSFVGHEVISTFAVYMYLQDKGKLNDSRLVSLGVLLHHHPMNLKDRMEKLSRREIRLGKEDFLLFYDEMKDILEPGWIPRDDINMEQVVKDVNSLLRSLWSEVWMNGDARTKRTFLLMIQGLVAADYWSASRNRGGKTAFGDVINKFIENFMSQID